MSTDSIIPKGSTILVIGANGLIASHVVEALLKAGFKVRGTARSASKLSTLQKRWDGLFGEGNFQISIVEDIVADGAFDGASKGVAGVIHLASILSFSTNPAEVVDPTVNATLSALKSAAKEPSVKRFVLTSSSTAALFPKANLEFDIGEDTWNNDSVQKAYHLEDTHLEKAWHVYGASKTLGERAAWKFMDDEKPGFSLNTVLPGTNFGPILDPEQGGSTAGYLRSGYQGDFGMLNMVPPQWFVDVRDTASLHVQALISPSLGAPGVRIWAVAAPFNNNDILAILRKLYPGKTFPDDAPGLGRDLSKIDNKRGGELLGGWIGLEESIKANTEGVE